MLPEVRISIAISREEAKERLEVERREGITKEVERLIGELSSDEGDGEQEEKEKK